MPNYCQNILRLSSKNKLQISKAVEAWRQGHFLAHFIPEPDYTKVKVKPAFFSIHKEKYVDPKYAWHDWRIQNWGTKWEVDSKELDITTGFNGTYFLAVDFDTAWSPPIYIYTKMSQLGFKVNAYYCECGNNFCGRYTTKRGDECYNVMIPSKVPNRKKYIINKDIPDSIIKKFSIRETIKETA